MCVGPVCVSLKVSGTTHYAISMSPGKNEECLGLGPTSFFAFFSFFFAFFFSFLSLFFSFFSLFFSFSLPSSSASALWLCPRASCMVTVTSMGLH